MFLSNPSILYSDSLLRRTDEAIFEAHVLSMIMYCTNI